MLFGQTEASCTIVKTRPGDAPEDKAETVGLPLPRTEARMLDSRTGAVVEPGVVGEICSRGYAVMHGYHEVPAATAVGEAAVVGVPDSKWGQQVLAFVRLAPGGRASEDDLHRFVREHLALRERLLEARGGAG